MLIRFNNLKIILSVLEAKPGGILGAMLSPYLFSTNMNDFCKRFNNQTQNYESTVYLTVIFFCDISEKLYTFFIKGIPLSVFYVYRFLTHKRLSVNFLYDLSVYLVQREKINIYFSACIIFSILRSFKKRRVLLFFYKKQLKKKIKI